ncbi:MAG: exonuclease SbcCD subunit D [Candidatus Latescibacterota bacterium]
MSIKLLHIADTHIGMENYGRVDSTTGMHTRVQDFVRCLRFAFSRGIEERVDLVIFSGDAYKTCTPNPTHQREFAAAIRMVGQAGIPVVMIVGNHDNPVSYGRASSIDIFGTLGIEHVHVFTKPELRILNTKSGPIQIVGFPWPTRSMLLTKEEYKNFSEEEITKKVQELCAHLIEHFAERVDPNIPAVLAGHLTAAGATLSGSERTMLIGRDPVLTTSVLAQSAFSYVALGHVHKFQNLNLDGIPPVVYSGSIERVDFGEEREDKGFCLVTIGDQKEGESENRLARDGEEPHAEVGNLPLFAENARPKANRWEARYQFVPVPARRFVTVEVTVIGDDPTGEILEEIARQDVSDAVVRVIYHVSEEQQISVDLNSIHDALRGAFLVASIMPRTQIPERVRRAEISEDLGLSEALNRYVANNPDLDPLREPLQIYAKQLEEELEASREL